MNITDESMVFSDDDFKEVFALFQSPTAYELRQTYDSSSDHYFRLVNLSEEYELTEEKREFAVDALRSVMTFLHQHGYRIEKGGAVFSLKSISEHFI
jgi:hypothetical protein